MKKEIHPEYHPKATVKCACGNSFTIGSTIKSFEVEICSKCHPFYTGKQMLVDTAGRVERFKARKAKAVAPQPKKERMKKPKTEPKKITPKK